MPGCMPGMACWAPKGCPNCGCGDAGWPNICCCCPNWPCGEPKVGCGAPNPGCAMPKFCCIGAGAGAGAGCCPNALKEVAGCGDCCAAGAGANASKPAGAAAACGDGASADRPAKSPSRSRLCFGTCPGDVAPAAPEASAPKVPKFSSPNAGLLPEKVVRSTAPSIGCSVGVAGGAAPKPRYLKFSKATPSMAKVYFMLLSDATLAFSTGAPSSRRTLPIWNCRPSSSQVC
mmetsp:Transcript_8819/g.33279  ORF Transcript_8819/g.33279 Transcript_8819/m.33279 type:complete len:231 (+) Transcript_8819:1335-2027(+)